MFILIIFASILVSFTEDQVFRGPSSSTTDVLPYPGPRCLGVLAPHFREWLSITTLSWTLMKVSGP